MSNSGSGVATPVSSAGVVGTLGSVVSRVRKRLDDTLPPYLWSDDELTENVDYIQKTVCSEMNILEERTEQSVCDIDVGIGDGLISLSPRITHIFSATIDGETMPLSLLPASQMDAYRVGWDTAEAESGTPKILVYSGVGTAKAYVYPLADAAYTMRLVVFRNPLVDLDFASHHAEQLEIARFAHLITNGVMYQAYLKQDADAYDPKKSEQHRVLWEGQDGHGGDKERIRRLVIKEKHRPEAANVTYAFM